MKRRSNSDNINKNNNKIKTTKEGESSFYNAMNERNKNKLQRLLKNCRDKKKTWIKDES